MKWDSSGQMSDKNKLKYIKNNQLDYEKWDACVNNAGNRNLYGQSWFLDIVSPGWEALVFGDYEFVMPLTVVKRLGIRAVLQPLHCQQLGIFPAPGYELQVEFCNRLFQLFPIVRYQHNAKAKTDAFGKFKFQEKLNFILPLHKSYEELAKNFSVNARRNIKKSEKQKVRVVKGLPPNEFFEWKNQSVKRKVPEKSHRILSRLMSKTLTNGQGVIYAAYSETNTLCAAAFMVFDGSRAYYLNAFSTEEGMQNRGMYAIVNHIVIEHSNSDVCIDFEGSMIDGVARFYKGFGAIPEKYFFTFSSKIPLVGKLI